MPRSTVEVALEELPWQRHPSLEEEPIPVGILCIGWIKSEKRSSENTTCTAFNRILLTVLAEGGAI
jgi:hypothetical protein